MSREPLTIWECPTHGRTLAPHFDFEQADNLLYNPRICPTCCGVRVFREEDVDALMAEYHRTALDREQQVALYEAAMNWFPDEEWRAFEESDEFRAIADRDATGRTQREEERP